jgi:3-hydroxyisobutyrate dehydrogenase-like beta-hydroxyacid dehydrogenase
LRTEELRTAGIEPQKGTRVGFAGLGIMGARMAQNLVRRGFPTVVWNRTPGRAMRVEGAVIATTPAALAADSEIVCLCVADPAAVRAVLLAPDGILAGAREGQLVVDFSTVGPEDARAFAAACAERGVGYVDAPVTGSRGGAEAGTLVIMAGGSEAHVARAEPIFAAVGERWVRCGDVGAGSQVKVAGNLLIAAMLQALSEGMLLTSQAGVDPRKLLEVVEASGFRSPYFTFKGKAILERDFDTNFSIDLMHKDLGLLLQDAAAHRIPMPTASSLRETYNLARAAGKGDQDIAAVITVLEDVCGVTLR